MASIAGRGADTPPVSVFVRGPLLEKTQERICDYRREGELKKPLRAEGVGLLDVILDLALNLEGHLADVRCL